MNQQIELNSTWLHHSGRIYEVIFIANIRSSNLINYPLTIVYKDENEAVWTRPAVDWYKSFTLLT
jgi:hypothetical protein